jgi:2,3-bisphosphoglycerate-dependent phosphoglycerate mutase
MALADTLRTEPIAGVYSSPYPRALQTVEPLAAALGVTVTLVPDLCERLLAPGPLPDWLEHCHRGWNDFDYALPGGETSRTAQRRMASALSLLAAKHPGETIAVASHGNLIALALNARDPEVDFDFWRSMPMPAVYPIDLPA